MREEELGEKLGQTLKNIYIPDDVLAQLESLLRSDTGRQETLQRQQRERLEQRLGFVRHRFEQAYMDKLDGNLRRVLGKESCRVAGGGSADSTDNSGCGTSQTRTYP
jgi:rRNA-processing protein FCF1